MCFEDGGWEGVQGVGEGLGGGRGLGGGVDPSSPP